MKIRSFPALRIFLVLSALACGLRSADAQTLKHFSDYFAALPALPAVPSNAYIRSHPKEAFDNLDDLNGLLGRLNTYYAQLERSLSSAGQRTTGSNSSTNTTKDPITSDAPARGGYNALTTLRFDSCLSIVTSLQNVRIEGDKQWSASQNTFSAAVEQAYASWRTEQQQHPCKGNANCMRRQDSTRNMQVAEATMAKIERDKQIVTSYIASVKPLTQMFDDLFPKASGTLTTPKQRTDFLAMLQAVRTSVSELGERIKLMRIDIETAAKLIRF